MIFGILSLNPRGNAALIRQSLKNAGAAWPGGDVHAGSDIGLRGSAGEDGFFEDAEENTRVIYSGKIYNYAELRGELEAAGAKFKSRLESELVLRAYDRWGAGCQERFNGEWAFAVWNGRKRQLFCSRDRFGLSSFYYFIDKDLFAFGSTGKILFSCQSIKKEPDNNAVFHYLAENNSEFPGGTFFKGIKPLEAGCCILLSPGRKPSFKRYYTPKYNPEMGEFSEKALRKHAAEFLELLKSAIKTQMSPPGTTGIMLSGGLDSSAIACLADGFSAGAASGRGSDPGKLRLFSINWKEEAGYIKAVAGAVSFKHCAISPGEVGGLPWEEMEKRVLASEVPFNSQSDIGHIRIQQRAEKANIKLLLDGNGADELVAGYPERYFNSYLNQIICAKDLPRFEREFKTVFAGRLREFGIDGEMPPGFYKIFLRSQSSAQQLSEFFRGETVDRSFLRRCAPLAGPPPGLPLNLQQELWRDTLGLGNWHIPIRPIKYRYPYLDHRLAEYCFSLPACYKIHDGWTKFVMRTALEGILPEKVCWRKDKVGGTVPIYTWKVFLARHKKKLKEILSARDFRSGEFLNQKAILRRFDALFEAAVSPDTSDVSGLWRFVNLELWLRENIR